MRETSTAMESSWKDGERDPYRAAYRTALETRNMEIGLFWQRSALLLAVNTAVAVGFFALDDRDTFLVVLLCLIGAVVSVLWLLVNLGSKYWQSRWEERLHRIEGRLRESEGVLDDEDLKLFSAKWDAIDADVQASLDDTRGGKNLLSRGLRRLYHRGVKKKFSVSAMMTLLSAFFAVVWAAAFAVYFISWAW
jgi:hypothetical protein